jgi:hypothetical protein
MGLMDLFIQAIGLYRNRTKIGLANLACNFWRLVWFDRRQVMASSRTAAARVVARMSMLWLITSALIGVVLEEFRFEI